MMKLIDTHTHFDVPEYAQNRKAFAQSAHDAGVRHLVLIGLMAQYFERMLAVKDELATFNQAPMAHVAFGLHPLYIQEQEEKDLVLLDEYLTRFGSVAIAEIGLDTYPKALQEAEIFAKQKAFFIEQVALAKHHQLPILLHIRKSHAEVLQILTQQKYQASQLGGIAHSFSGGEQEALAFVKRGFKLGITGQITNPNAKKLHRAVMAVFAKYGVDAFVIETDCPDMMPVPCQHLGHFNEPANLRWVLAHLATMFDIEQETLARKLWQNSCEALRVDWNYE
ncbi:TatD family hydrolase [Moraxella nasicaprae]|uniref:TatD family hydrolase n=1 Tax=Moraxella nasicaprae TaxID=2904122 RepID=A0ABY6F2R3_9GAMM|nr:TatD family hydrolase [Moraxella nasicaprae]UXZ04362.1 TatD family hydrolase [Moraxella nasicaprae]